jgi:hypothetical protein
VIYKIFIQDIRYAPMICRRYLPLMKSEMSIAHMPIAIAITIFALFQMAILPSYLEHIASKGCSLRRGRTHGAQSTAKRQQRQGKQRTRMRNWVMRPGHMKGEAHDFKSDPDLENIVD